MMRNVYVPDERLLVIEELISCLWIFKHLKNSIYSLVKLGVKGGGFS